MKQEEYWNSVSEKKEFTTPFLFETFSNYVKRDQVILDVGCGYGRTLDELYHNAYRNLIGIQEQEELMQEIKRILKPQGILYVNDFLLNTDERNLERYRKYKEIYGVYGVFELPEGAVCRHHDEKWIRQLLQDFSEKEYSLVTKTTMNGHQSNGFYFIGQLMR